MNFLKPGIILFGLLVTTQEAMTQAFSGLGDYLSFSFFRWPATFEKEEVFAILF